ncbi:hypothetical protein D1007_22216 [Hordeum vulgare]|nr:hypothetical protein D1007_22216 [Hordeum vulgare]
MVVLQLFKNDEYVSYDSEKKKRKNKTPSESTNDSEDTNNKNRKIGSSILKKRSENLETRRDQLDVVRRDFVLSLINTTNREKQMVLVDDVVVLSKYLQCLTQKDECEDGVWLAHELMHHDEPIDTGDGQVVYIERVAGITKLERDGRIEECYEDALAGIPGTTQGTSYLKHDMAYIDKFRRDLLVVLADSPYNKMKYRKRFKQYHASLSDAAMVEDDEDASS